MKKHAVLIGINNYSRLGVLRYARQDAEATADALKRCYGFSDDEITLMTDESKNKPEDRFAIEDALSSDFYGNDLELFVFGFFGHGIWEDGQRYLCPMNVRDRRLTQSALPLKDVQDLLGNIRAKNICLILDCCQNEVSTEGRSAAQAMTEGEEKSLDLLARDILGIMKENTKNPGFDPTVVVLNSCKKGERAFESVERQHGLFTAVLLDAMEQRCKSTAELCDYVRDNVPKSLRTTGVHQTPYYTCSGGSNILLPVVQKGYDVFLSYRRDGGSVLAKLIQTQLESRNLRVFLDIDESMAGGYFDEKLFTMIEASSCFVPILSSGCFSRSDAMSDGDWVYKELLHAVRKHKPIVPVFVPGFEWDHESVPQRIEWLPRIDGIAYHSIYVNAFLDSLAKAVRNPGQLNHEAILEQMTMLNREPESEKYSKTAEEDENVKEERDSAKKMWTIGGIIVGVILLGVSLGTLVINAGNQVKRMNGSAPMVMEKPVSVAEKVVPTNETAQVVIPLTVPTDVPTLADAYEKIAIGGTITVLRGKYDVPKTITITKNVTIIGDVNHPENVILQGGEENVFHLQSGFAEIAGLTIQNEGKKGSCDVSNVAVQFSAPLGELHDCVFTSTYGTGFIVNTKDSKPDVKNCIARNCGLVGFRIGSGASGTFRNCTASGNVLSGMEVRDANTNPTVEDCHFTDGKSAGFFVYDGASGMFTKCTASGNAYAGMGIRDANTNPTVEDCQFTDGKSAGILVSDGAFGTFRKCTASGNTSSGMQVRDANTNPTVEDCHFTDGKTGGILIILGASGTFTNCIVSRNAYSGMAVRDAQSNPIVEFCVFEKNQESGVCVYDGASGTFKKNKLSGNSTTYGNWNVSRAASDLVREGNTPNK